MASIRLHSSCLRSKWGFEDGDILSDILSETGFHDRRHTVLCALVKKHIVPRLPEYCEVYEIETCHNPIRLENPKAEFDDFVVEISVSEILKITKETP